MKVTLVVCFLFCVPWISCCQSRWSKNTRPTLEFRPLPAERASTLVWYNPGKPSSYWKKELEAFLKPYTQKTRQDNAAVVCSWDQPPEGRFCDFRITPEFGPCTSEYDYGFSSTKGGPCVFLKLNKIPGWVPKYYNSTTVPRGMPEHVRTAIIEGEKRGRHHVVWVDCYGVTPADQEFIGPLNYYPRRGFKGVYFPFTGIEGYLSPLVAVHFEQPMRGVVINVECKAWAQNINHDGEEKKAMVNFELLIE
jgi:sodium/potassium-transporting ATPase subunit beta